MTDEVSEHTRIAITVWMTGALLSAVLGVTIMSINILNNYTSKYTNAVMGSADSTVFSLQGNNGAPGAIVYSSVSESVNSIDCVYILNDDGTKEYLYLYNDSGEQNLIKLMTMYKNKTYLVSVVDGELVKTLHTVKLKEVTRDEG